jgi:hypothetical protein
MIRLPDLFRTAVCFNTQCLVVVQLRLISFCFRPGLKSRCRKLLVLMF